MCIGLNIDNSEHLFSGLRSLTCLCLNRLLSHSSAVVLWDNCSMLETGKKWEIYWRNKSKKILKTEIQIKKLVTRRRIQPLVNNPHYLSSFLLVPRSKAQVDFP